VGEEQRSAGGEPASRTGLGREDVATWLQGPRGAQPDAYGAPGERLGLPGAGPGSVAGWGRRLGAIFLDWVAALLVAGVVSGHAYGSSTYRAWDTLAVFGLEVIVLTTLMGASFGQRMLALRVVGVDGGRLGPLAVVERTLLLCLAFPALIWDRDRRGLHDKLARSVVVNAR
jgi:uncharacterized RDD family membrane protein YckC